MQSVFKVCGLALPKRCLVRIVSATKTLFPNRGLPTKLMSYSLGPDRWQLPLFPPVFACNHNVRASPSANNFADAIPRRTTLRRGLANRAVSATAPHHRGTGRYAQRNLLRHGGWRQTVAVAVRARRPADPVCISVPVLSARMWIYT